MYSYNNKFLVAGMLVTTILNCTMLGAATVSSDTIKIETAELKGMRALQSMCLPTSIDLSMAPNYIFLQFECTGNRDMDVPCDPKETFYVNFMLDAANPRKSLRGFIIKNRKPEAPDIVQEVASSHGAATLFSKACSACVTRS